MESLGCQDLGVACPFRAEGKTTAEVKQHLLEHAGVAHADLMAGMSEEQQAEFMRTLDEKLAKA